MKEIETWLKSRYSEQLIHENSAFISSIIHDYCTEVVKNNAVLPLVSNNEVAVCNCENVETTDIRLGKDGKYYHVLCKKPITN